MRRTAWGAQHGFLFTELASEAPQSHRQLPSPGVSVVAQGEQGQCWRGLEWGQLELGSGLLAAVGTAVGSPRTGLRASGCCGDWGGVSPSWAQGSWLLRGLGWSHPELGSGLLVAVGTGRQEELLALELGRLSRPPGTPMMGGGDLRGEFPMPLGQRATICTTPVKHRDPEGLGAPQRGTAGRERSQGPVGVTVSGPRRAPSFCGHPSPSLLAP